MKVTYIEETGVVTGINRGPCEGESSINADPQEFIHDYKIGFYYVSGETLRPITQEEVDLITNTDLKYTAMQSMLSKIDELNSTKNKSNFNYSIDGVEHSYYSDKDSLDTIEGNCLSKLARGGACTDPVPAPNGVWKTADLNEDGITPHYQTMSIIEFLGLTDTLTEKGITNFGVKEYHKNNLKNLYANPESTVASIESYDFSQGWI